MCRRYHSLNFSLVGHLFLFLISQGVAETWVSDAHDSKSNAKILEKEHFNPGQGQAWTSGPYTFTPSPIELEQPNTNKEDEQENRWSILQYFLSATEVTRVRKSARTNLETEIELTPTARKGIGNVAKQLVPIEKRATSTAPPATEEENVNIVKTDNRYENKESISEEGVYETTPFFVAPENDENLSKRRYKRAALFLGRRTTTEPAMTTDPGVGTFFNNNKNKDDNNADENINANDHNNQDAINDPGNDGSTTPITNNNSNDNDNNDYNDNDINDNDWDSNNVDDDNVNKGNYTEDSGDYPSRRVSRSPVASAPNESAVTSPTFEMVTPAEWGFKFDESQGTVPDIVRSGKSMSAIVGFSDIYHQCSDEDFNILHTTCKKYGFSCINRCGLLGQSPSNAQNWTCSCDHHCIVYGDCCKDFQFVCPAQYNESLAFNHFENKSTCLINGYALVNGCTLENGVYQEDKKYSSYDFALTDKATGIHYKNYSMFACNGGKLRDAIFWYKTLKMRSDNYQHSDDAVFNLIQNNTEGKQEHVPPPGIDGRHCYIESRINCYQIKKEMSCLYVVADKVWLRCSELVSYIALSDDKTTVDSVSEPTASKNYSLGVNASVSGNSSGSSYNNTNESLMEEAMKHNGSLVNGTNGIKNTINSSSNHDIITNVNPNVDEYDDLEEKKTNGTYGGQKNPNQINRNDSTSHSASNVTNAKSGSNTTDQIVVNEEDRPGVSAFFANTHVSEKNEEDTHTETYEKNTDQEDHLGRKRRALKRVRRSESNDLMTTGVVSVPGPGDNQGGAATVVRDGTGGEAGPQQYEIGQDSLDKQLVCMMKHVLEMQFVRTIQLDFSMLVSLSENANTVHVSMESTESDWESISCDSFARCQVTKCGQGYIKYDNACLVPKWATIRIPFTDIKDLVFTKFMNIIKTTMHEDLSVTLEEFGGQVDMENAWEAVYVETFSLQGKGKYLDGGLQLPMTEALKRNLKALSLSEPGMTVKIFWVCFQFQDEVYKYQVRGSVQSRESTIDGDNKNNNTVGPRSNSVINSYTQSSETLQERCDKINMTEVLMERHLVTVLDFSRASSIQCNAYKIMTNVILFSTIYFKFYD